MNKCIFCRIIERSLPAEFVFEDDNLIAIRDINPQAPVHVLIIPKAHYPTIEDAPPAVLGEMCARAARLASDLKISSSGYRTVVNCRDHAGQTVMHLHLHLLGGRWFHWPPG